MADSKPSLQLSSLEQNGSLFQTISLIDRLSLMIYSFDILRRGERNLKRWNPGRKNASWNFNDPLLTQLSWPPFIIWISVSQHGFRWTYRLCQFFTAKSYKLCYLECLGSDKWSLTFQMFRNLKMVEKHWSGSSREEKRKNIF